MPVYTYAAKNIQGKTIKGQIEANDQSTVIVSLKEKGLFPIKVGVRSGLDTEINLSFKRKISDKDLGILCRQFSVMLNAGLPVLNILDILRQQLENKITRATMLKVYEDVQKGSSLSEAMAVHDIFPDILLNMVQAGESSGNLEGIFEKMAIHFEKGNRLSRKVQSALIYPIILVCVATIVILVLVTFVVPTFVTMFSDMSMQLPVTTRALIGLAAFMKSKWYVLVIIIAAAVIAVRQLYKRDGTGNWFDGIKLKLPLFGNVIIKSSCSRFAETLSSLLGSGLSMISALEITSRVVGNRAIEGAIKNSIEKVGRGSTLSETLKSSGIFPPMLINMIEIGEDSGTLEEVLKKTADVYDEEVEDSVTKLTAMMEPAIIVILAVVVGFIVLSIVQPMFQMYGNFKA